MRELINRLAQPLTPRAYRGRILHSINAKEWIFLEDGGLLVNEKGLIEACEDWLVLEQTGALVGWEPVVLAEDALIIPGFIDLHVHLPQMEVAGSQERDLLSWLERHIFAAEARFSDSDHARQFSRWFFEELLKNGTTTAAVFLTSHGQATQIAFETAYELGNRVVMGQNLMDLNAPAELLKPTAQNLLETEMHCKTWHGQDNGRIQYAWMPRFAITSTEDLLAGIGQLRQRYPSVYLHTHLSEQLGEIEAVRQQFPWAADYTQVYEKFGLLASRTILAHGIHLSDDELSRIQAVESSLAHCPCSNFFLKSGRFRLLEILQRQLRFGLGSDVGAGPELSMFKAMKDAQFMQPDTLVSLQTLFYAATLGGAKALFQDDRIGNFESGKEADFLILETQGKSCMSLLNSTTSLDIDVDGLLSSLLYLGDDRLIRSTYIRGQKVYQKQ
jgi:guanine deaminase